MSGSVSIKSFTLKLDSTRAGKPKPTTINCVYSLNTETNMTIGYILGVGPNITELKCFPLGLQGQSAFMNTDKQQIGDLYSYRLGFSDRNGELSGYMMQGQNGDDIIATANFSKEEVEQVIASAEKK